MGSHAKCPSYFTLAQRHDEEKPKHLFSIYEYFVVPEKLVVCNHLGGSKTASGNADARHPQTKQLPDTMVFAILDNALLL